MKDYLRKQLVALSATTSIHTVARELGTRTALVRQRDQLHRLGKHAAARGLGDEIAKRPKGSRALRRAAERAAARDAKGQRW